MPEPDADMIAAAARVAGFIASRGAAPLTGVFADQGVTIIENFPPHVFSGPGAVDAWAAGMRAHLAGVTGLVHSFGAAHDFRRTGGEAYISLSTTWRGIAGGRPFTEDGGWSFLLTRQGGAWRVKAYAWSVTAWSWD